MSKSWYANVSVYPRDLQHTAAWYECVVLPCMALTSLLTISILEPVMHSVCSVKYKRI